MKTTHKIGNTLINEYVFSLKVICRDNKLMSKDIFQLQTPSIYLF